MSQQQPGIAYGFEKNKAEDQNILVYDLGGGTFDVSLLTISKGEFIDKATSGDTYLGGDDVNSNLIDYFAKRIKKSYNRDILTEKAVVQKFKIKIEKAKRHLSLSFQATIEIDNLLEDFNFEDTLSRATLESLNMDLFSRTLEPIDEVLSASKLKMTEIKEVVLVGGSTRIPIVQQLIKSRFNGKELNRNINPDEAVASGAAIQAAFLGGVE